MRVVGLLLAGLLASTTAQSPDARVALPKASEADLDNGLHVVVLEDRRRPVIAFQLLIPGAGGYQDADDELGLAAATAALLRQGTPTRSPIQVAAQLEEMSAQLTIEADAASPDAVISGTCPADQATKLLDLATDLLLHPAFAEEDVTLYQEQLQKRLADPRDAQLFVAREIFARATFGGRPVARAARHVMSRSGVTRERIMEFHRTRYAPDHAVLAIAGDVSPFAAKFFVGQKLGGWKRADTEPPAAIDAPSAERTRVLVIEQPDASEVTLLLGSQGVTRTSDDYPAAQLLTELLTGIVVPAFPGVWLTAMTEQNDGIEPAVQDLLALLTRLRMLQVSDTDLAQAKQVLIDSFAQSLQSPDHLAAFAAARTRYGLSDDYWESYPARIDAVTAEQVQTAAQKYLAPERLQVVLVGDSGKMAGPLEQLGPVEP